MPILEFEKINELFRDLTGEFNGRGLQKVGHEATQRQGLVLPGYHPLTYNVRQSLFYYFWIFLQAMTLQILYFVLDLVFNYRQ